MDEGGRYSESATAPALTAAVTGLPSGEVSDVPRSRTRRHHHVCPRHGGAITPSADGPDSHGPDVRNGAVACNIASAVTLQSFWRRLRGPRGQHGSTSAPTAIASSPSCDVLLLVAIEAEVNALQSVCGELGIAMEPKQWAPIGDYFDLGIVGSDRVFAARTTMGALRHEGSAYKAILFQRAAQATSIIQIGMAFGIDPLRQHHGDVLIASAIFPYDDRTILSDQGQPVVDYSRTKRRRAKPALLKLFERELKRGGHAFTTHTGTLLSGSARIFCRRFRDDLVKSIPGGSDPIIGGDMEGLGLLAVSHASSPLWAVVKGISDFADEDRDGIIEATRPLACENAVRFVLGALRNNPGS